MTMPFPFTDFFRAVHGRAPFPWQMRLAALLEATNRWPSALDLPTGSGKTACIDIALHHLVVRALEGKAHEAARRVAFVVDRRIIVDEAANRAERIRRALEVARDGVLVVAREAIQRLAETREGDELFDIVTLRGGIPRERNLVRDPTRPAIVLSTVDQIGSRLLFRGYGVTERMSPMHAGIFGVDTLLLLDEAHIAEPFRKTLRGIAREQGRASDALGPRPLRFVELSATLGDGTDVFSLTDADRADPVLRRRLEAKKAMQVFEVAKREELTKKLVELVLADLDAEPLTSEEAPRVGVVVNRVATARAVHSALAKKFGAKAEVALLIGQTRPIDRDELLARVGPMLAATGERRPGDRPVIVVATQTIEVGADFDFHALYAEGASYPALKQRFGRLNRLGARESARGAVVFVVGDEPEDPIYGKTLGATRRFLLEHQRDGVVDFGVTAAPIPSPALPAGQRVAQDPPPTPELSPSILGLFTQTSPRPAVEPEVSQYLHGFSDQLPDVNVVWRDGLDPSSHAELDVLTLDRLPPLSLEAMRMPLVTFLRWCRARSGARSKDIGGSDVEVTRREDDDDGDGGQRVYVVDDRQTRSGKAGQVRPGATVVIPTSWGGCDAFGFAPDSKVHVNDHTFRAREELKKSGAMVWTFALARDAWGESEEDGRAYLDSARALLQTLDDDDATPRDAVVSLRDWFETWAVGGHPRLQKLHALFDSLGRSTKPPVGELLRVNDNLVGIALRASKPTFEDFIEEGNGLQETVAVELIEHCAGVGAFAERFGSSVGLTPALVADLALAGRLHDLGKAEPRFQAMLGGDGSMLLAKGVRGAGGDMKIELGERHECYSVSLIRHHRDLVKSATDPELVEYLVGTHHGFGRALQPNVDDRGSTFTLEVAGARLAHRGPPGLAAIDSGWPEMYARLERRYGPWGLAYLETVLRLADHRRSEQEVERA